MAAERRAILRRQLELDRLADQPVREREGPGDRPGAVRREPGLEDASLPTRLDRRVDGVWGGSRHREQERLVKVHPDHGSLAEYGAGPSVKPGEGLLHGLADTARDGRIPAAQGPADLEDEERVAAGPLEHVPGALSRRRARHDRLQEERTRARVEPVEPDRLRAPGATEAEEARCVEVGGGPAGHHQREGQVRRAAGDGGQQPQGPQVSPLRIVQHEQGRSPIRGHRVPPPSCTGHRPFDPP
ncbi:MAG: hypothetical protein ACYDAN_17495 [Candidatus Limnocylindrales bacterium]